MVFLDEGSGMKCDSEVLLMRRERAKGRSQEQAAARAGLSVRTLRRYERRSKLPSQLQQPRTYRTRPSPFEADWPWITGQLERDPALQGTTLFGLLQELHPGRYQQSQLRTLHRQIAAWRAQYGPGREVIFPQIHTPGEAAQSDFTHMTRLGITLGGVQKPAAEQHRCDVASPKRTGGRVEQVGAGDAQSQDDGVPCTRIVPKQRDLSKPDRPLERAKASHGWIRSECHAGEVEVQANAGRCADRRDQTEDLVIVDEHKAGGKDRVQHHQPEDYNTNDGPQLSHREGVRTDI